MVVLSRAFLHEKIIVRPADDFVHGHLFHPKWSAQYPPLSFSVCVSSSDVSGIRRPRAVTWASHTS